LLKRIQFSAASAILGLVVAMCPLSAAADEDHHPASFQMVVSAGAKTCLPNASGSVRVFQNGGVQTMEVSVRGLAPNTDYDFFVIQVPKSPFGIAWYQGDITTDKNGNGHLRVVGIFSVETFAVATGSAAAPVVFNGPFPDASLNPAFNPIQMYHLGLWFDSPTAAQGAGCPATVTPFNGEHNAGLQVLNTSNFPDDHGPLRDVTSPAPKPKDD
jgi:hypothetical protein